MDDTSAVAGAPRFLFSPARAVRAYERVVEQIEDAVATGRFPPGAHLPSERELTVQFSVSRATVREALRVLESSGLVRSRPGDPRGPQVLAPTADGLHKTMSRLARLDALSTSELVQFRMIVDGSACLLAATCRTPEDLAAMRAALEQMRSGAHVDPTAFGEADTAFHTAIAVASGNALLRVCCEVVRSVSSELISTRVGASPDSRGTMLTWADTDTAVYAAIERGDGPGAADLVRRNLLGSYGGLVDPHQREVLRELL